jgi:SAM-dependent methyltransferase
MNSSVLVVGGGIDGHGFNVLRDRKDLNIICTDVSLEYATDFICDGHNLPFRDGIFQCVIFQAVLEHVLDPKICVKEAHRVLSRDGLIYAETPFMQQVHMGAYDFQRFTESGHRRLFSFFREISSGVACGAGSALCWSLIYFLQSFTSKRKIKTLLHIIGRLVFFPVKYFDHFTHNTRGSIDGASGFYFLGAKTEGQSVSDCELVKRYNGLN